jgi:D-alanine-D-alanine ligase
MKIGIVYDLKDDYSISSDNINFTDFSHLSEVETVKNNLELIGYEALYIGSPRKFIELIKQNNFNCDLVFNMSEGYRSRNREGLIPGICEIYGIPYTGSDAFGLSLSLHKYQTKCFVESLGVNTPRGFLYDTQYGTIDYAFKLLKDRRLHYPLILKPNHEGSSNGIKIVCDTNHFMKALEILIQNYQQEILVEEFISGMEIASCVLGGDAGTQVISIVEYRNPDGSSINLFTSDLKRQNDQIIIHAEIPSETKCEIIESSVKIHNMMHLYDLSRIDWKIDRKTSTPFFLEITPLPDLSEGDVFDWSSRQMGHQYSYIFQRIIDSTRKRYGI